MSKEVSVRTVEEIQADMNSQMAMIRLFSNDGRSDGYCNSDYMRVRDAYEALDRLRRELKNAVKSGE